MIYDLIIIGAGPAGISSAVYAGRQKMNVLVISKDVGGQVAKKAVDIENYPGFEKISGPDLTKRFEEQLKTTGIKTESEEVLKITKEENKFLISTSQGNNYESLTVIITTGADPRPLEVPGEKEFIGKGVSYCALCDGPIFKDKVVAVIGGGNSAFETASFLSNYVKKIYILECGENLRADKENQEIVKKAGKAEIITSAKVLKFMGDPMVNSLTYQDTKTKKEISLDVEGVFIEVGYSPSTAFAKELVDFTEKDEIKVETETYQTKTAGLFAAGDCNQGKYRQIVTAAGEGAKAALAAYEYLQKTKK